MSQTQETPLNASALGLRGERGPILLAIMVSSALAALDSTILATAVPSIVANLGGFSHFPWLFSIYLLAQAVSVPIWAKLSDMIGRKPILLAGITLFLVASLFCMSAWSMVSLILFRALQGLGAGAILPIANTIAGDIYSVEERAKVQGYLASVWGISSVVGPALGGLFSQYLTWRLIFFINLPLGILAIYLLFHNYHEKVHHRAHKVDYLGAGLLTTALTLVLLAVLEGGQAWAWDSVPSVAALTAGGLLLTAFFWAERRAHEPVLPFWIFTRPLLLSTSLVSLGIGAVLLGLTAYIPTYLVRSLGVSPLVAGASIASLMLGWPVAASQSGRFYLKIGFRSTVLLGLLFILGGTTALAVFAQTPSVLVVTLACFFTGLGFGLVGTPIIVAAQASVPWNERGVVTGSNQFFRAVGSSVGVAVFGALANAVFLGFHTASPGVQPIKTATEVVFWATVVTTLLSAGAAWAMPKQTPRRTEGPLAG